MFDLFVFSAKGPHQLWTEEQDEELKSLYERYHDNCEGGER